MNPPEKSNCPLLCNESPWNNNENRIWLATTLQLHRSLEKYHFPSKLAADKRKQIISLLTKSLTKSGQLKQPKLLAAEEMSPAHKEYLVEHFLSNQGFQQASTGEAFVLDETGEFLAVLNLRDHIFLEWIDTKEDLENSWDRLVQIESELARSVNFAFSPKFGFLTSDPTQCGTGMVVTIFLHLPALLVSNSFGEIINTLKDDGVEQTGLQGDPTEFIGDIVAFHNSYTLGVTEENILSTLRTLATKLVLEEIGKRKSLKFGNETEVAEIKDKVSRAFAILMHSYQIEAVEALQALSLVKLGLDLEWIKGTTQGVLNRLIFACRRGHLMCHYGENISIEELPHRRAEFIHQTLHGLELLIT